MPRKKFKHVKKFLPFIGIVLLIGYILWKLDVEDIKIAFLKISPIFVFLSITLTIPRVLIRSHAWHFILKEQKIKIGYWQTLKIFLIGYFYGSFTPGYLGQLMRIPYLKEKTDQPYGKLFVNSVIETTSHTLSAYFVILIGSVLIIEQIPQLFIIVLIWILILAALIIYFIGKNRGEKLLFGLIKYFIPKRAKSNLKEFVKTFYNGFPRIHRLIYPVFLGFLTWIIIFSQEYIFVIALGLEIPYLHFLIFFPIANAAGFLPISFAGLGPREITAILIFTTLFPSVTGEEILVVSVMGFIITDLITGFIGFLVSLTETTEHKLTTPSVT